MILLCMTCNNIILSADSDKNKDILKTNNAQDIIFECGMFV